MKAHPSFMVHNEKMAPSLRAHHDKRVILDDGLLIRRLPDKKRIIAFGWDRVHRVSMHYTYSCMHSNARITDLKPGQTETRRGKIYLVGGSVEDVAKRYRKEFAGRRTVD